MMFRFLGTGAGSRSPETNKLIFLIEIFPEDLFNPPVRKEHDRE